MHERNQYSFFPNTIEYTVRESNTDFRTNMVPNEKGKLKNTRATVRNFIIIETPVLHLYNKKKKKKKY